MVRARQVSKKAKKTKTKATHKRTDETKAIDGETEAGRYGSGRGDE